MALLSLILAKALPLLFILDPFGVVGIVSTIIKPFSPEIQRKILRREVFLALLIMLFFYGFGAVFLAALDISQAAVLITGGIIFFMFALNLLFPSQSPMQLETSSEPFLVPIATPLITGPSCLATIILYSHEEVPASVVLPAIGLAWLVAGGIILLTPWIVQRLGETGIKVLEQIVGLICAMIAIEMILSGIQNFSHHL
jgi:multiple antibiotic resistance protein